MVLTESGWRIREGDPVAEVKTKQNDASVADFLAAIKDDQARRDCRVIDAIMQKATGARPEMWGTSIVGYGSYTYHYAGGRTADWPLIAFSPRKQNLTLYITTCDAKDRGDEREALMAQLGKHSCGKACLYIRRLSDVHVPTLKKLIQVSVKSLKKRQANNRLHR